MRIDFSSRPGEDTARRCPCTLLGVRRCDRHRRARSHRRRLRRPAAGGSARRSGGASGWGSAACAAVAAAGDNHAHAAAAFARAGRRVALGAESALDAQRRERGARRDCAGRAKQATGVGRGTHRASITASPCRRRRGRAASNRCACRTGADWVSVLALAVCDERARRRAGAEARAARADARSTGGSSGRRAPGRA